MPESKKKWTVIPSRGENIIVEADRLDLNETNARATFYLGDEVIASFVGFNAVYPTPS